MSYLSIPLRIGAGIGRVSKHLLLHRFQHVDLIEQSPRLLAAAPEYIGVQDGSERVTCIVQGLQVCVYFVLLCVRLCLLVCIDVCFYDIWSAEGYWHGVMSDFNLLGTNLNAD